MAKANTMTRNTGFFDVTTVMGDLRVPGIDMEAAVSSRRKNIEALTQANQLAVEGVHAVMRRQVEITRQAMEDFSAMFRDLVQPNGSPEDRFAKQAEYSKHAIEQSLSNAKELTELVTKANTEAFSVINKRVTESLEEVRDFAKKQVAARSSIDHRLQRYRRSR
jgi:phasin family protein